jgi:two-component system CheB/CheR fusion protein
VQLQPYLERDGRRRGAIVTLTDVGELVRLRTAAEAALAEFTNLTNALEEAVWKRDGAMQRLLYASARMATLTGWSAAELQDQPGLLDGRIDPADREQVRAARESGQPRWAVRYRLQRRDGQWLWLNEVATVVGEGAERCVVGTLADVSPLQAAEARALEMASIFESVFRTQVFGVAVLNGQGRVVMANGAFCDLVGCTAESVVGLSLERLRVPVAPTPEADGTDASEPPLRDGLRELQLRSHSGRLVWVTAETHLLPQPIGETVALLVVQDVTALRESTQLLERQARVDAATGLFNRSTFTDTLQREISRCQRDQSQLALAWIDLDHFKEVNDVYGHDAGDVVLQTVSERLQQVVRGQDCVGRLGGDEFGIVVSGYDGIGELESMLQRVMAMLRQPIAIAGAEVRVGGSVGISLYPDDSSELEGLMSTSDAAMYAVKATGGDAFAYFTPQMNSDAEERRTMQQQIAAAIHAGQFELHYQPILRVADGRVWGVEALLRWRRDGASIPAGDFIAFAEESGLVRQFSPLVLGLLRADLESLRASGAEALRVSVNLSVRQLQDPELAAQLAPGPEPSALAGLVLEARESVCLPDHAQALATLQQLRRQGAEICIDDYGMGCSNIRVLRSLKPRYVKLNHQVLQLCGGNAQGRRLLRAASDMGHALGALVVIEGIETAAQRELAAEVKADLIQGYLLAEPMPIERLLAWLAERPGS